MNRSTTLKGSTKIVLAQMKTAIHFIHQYGDHSKVMYAMDAISRLDLDQILLINDEINKFLEAQ